MIKINYLAHSFSKLNEEAELLIHDNLFKVVEVKEGGMGKIIFCKKIGTSISEDDYFLPNFIALKAIHHELSSNLQIRNAFKKELLYWSQVDQIGCTKLIGIGILPSNDGYVAITELYDGNLKNLIHKGISRQHKKKGYAKNINYSNLQKYLTFHDKVIIINSITSSVLNLVNDLKIMHLDLKPENILFNIDEKISAQSEYNAYELNFIINDLGLSRFKNTTRSISLESTSSFKEQENTLNFFGTPLYMAPERFKKNYKPSESADVFAIGLIFYELLFNQHFYENLSEAMNHNDDDLIDKLNTKIKNELPELKIYEQKWLFRILFCFLREKESERINLQQIKKILLEACFDQKKVFLKIKKSSFYVHESEILKFDQTKTSGIISSILLNRQIDNTLENREKIKNQLLEMVENLVFFDQKFTLIESKIDFLSFYDKIHIYQHGLLNLLKKIETTSLSLFSETSLNQEYFGNYLKMEKKCNEIMKFIYALNGYKKINYSVDYLNKIKANEMYDLMLRDSEKFFKNPKIFSLAKATQMMIENFCVGDRLGIDESFGRWCKRENYTTFICPEENMETFNNLSGIVFKRQDNFLEVKNVKFEQILKYRYKLTIQTEAFVKKFGDKGFDKTNFDSKEEFEFVCDQNITPTRILDTSKIKTETTNEVFQAFRKIYF